MDRDFEIGSRQFKLLKIDAFKQFHIVRRIAPILAELAPSMVEIAKLGKANPEGSPEVAAKFIGPIMNGLSKLSDEDSNRVLFGLLSAVEMKQESGNWARLATDNALMFADIELPVMLQAAGKAFMFNLSGFFGALPRV